VQRQFEITEERIGADGIVVLAVVGDVDLLTTDELTERLRETVAVPNRVVVLDLTGVRFLGSAGLAALLAGADAANAGGIEFRLVANSRGVLRPLDVTGANASLSVYDTLDAALAHGQ
jgi:anti-anti-sigma factor